MHLTKLLLILLFFSLPLVHGNLLPTLGIPFSLSVSWNFEFTKVMFFNILSGLIFLSFFGERVFLRWVIYRLQLPPSSLTLSHLPLRRRLYFAPLHRGGYLREQEGELEEVILHNLHAISKDKTSIIASHRISSIKNADKIIVINNKTTCKTERFTEWDLCIFISYFLIYKSTTYHMVGHCG